MSTSASPQYTYARALDLTPRSAKDGSDGTYERIKARCFRRVAQERLTKDEEYADLFMRVMPHKEHQALLWSQLQYERDRADQYTVQALALRDYTDALADVREIADLDALREGYAGTVDEESDTCARPAWLMRSQQRIAVSHGDRYKVQALALYEYSERLEERTRGMPSDHARHSSSST